MTTLAVVSLALNVAAGAVLVVQRLRYERLAASSCSSCPFVTHPAAARIPVPTYQEPPTVLLNLSRAD